MHIRILIAPLTIACFLHSSCIVAVAPVHDESAVVSKELEDHTATFSFANLYDRDSQGTDKPGGIRMLLQMHRVGPMDLRMGRASVSRNGGPWQPCRFGKQAFNAGGRRPYDYSSFEKNSLRYPNYFNVMVLCPAETVPADRSKGYAGLDPLKRGVYRIRIFYTLNSKNFDHEVQLKLDRNIKAGGATILDVVAPWSSMDG